LILGAIERDLNSSSFALYIRGLCSVLQKHGYNLAILWVGEARDTQMEKVKNFLMSDTADGYILGASMLEEQSLEVFRNSGRPILSFNNN
jgi:DNA-binding LacI/PurR family transcriptional regulator